MSASDQYLRAGVDIQTGDAFVRRLSPVAAATHGALTAQGASLLSASGGFAAAVALPPGLKEPVLVSCADGVGTKVEFARLADKPEVVGRDVVAMCVNDLACSGARPLYFLDYLAFGTLRPDFALRIVDGIVQACELAGCALIGGETAEMPGVYAEDKFDVAGFAVGVGEKAELFNAADIAPGDALIAVASDGAHSNGYSLAREILRRRPALADEQIDGEAIGDLLLRPTRIYCRAVDALRGRVSVRAAAHITGGGLVGNLPRLLPAHLAATVDLSRCPLPPLFSALRRAGGVSDEEMRRVFNCGIGMVIAVPARQRQAAIDILSEQGETAWRIGEVGDNPAPGGAALRFV